MNDCADYLTTLITYYDNFVRNTKQIVYLLDSELNVIAFNRACVEMYTDQSRFTGKNQLNLIDDILHDCQSKDEALSLYQHALDQKIIKKFIGINFNRVEEFIILHFDIIPIINPITAKTIALQCYASKLDWPLHWYSIPNILQNSAPRTQKIKSSILENEALFLMFHFETYEEIAAVMSLAHKNVFTKNFVGKLIRRKLYPRFNAAHNRDLKIKAAMAGYHRQIPISLMSETIIQSSSM